MGGLGLRGFARSAGSDVSRVAAIEDAVDCRLGFCWGGIERAFSPQRWGEAGDVCQAGEFGGGQYNRKSLQVDGKNAKQIPCGNDNKKGHAHACGMTTKESGLEAEHADDGERVRWRC